MLVEAIIEASAARAGAPAIVHLAERVGFDQLIRAVRERAAAHGMLTGAVVVRGHAVEVLIEALAVRLAGGVPLVLGPDEPPPLKVALPEGTAWLRTTGGTTGAPRLVAVSDRQAHAGAENHARLMTLEPGATVALTVPPWTTYGWNAWTGALMSGATVRYLPATAPRALLGALAEVAWGVTTPPVVRALARLEAEAPRRMAPLLTAAAPYPADEAQIVAERHGVAVIDRYGSTEAGGAIAQARVPGGPLWPAPGVTVRDADGRLVVEGPAVALGIVGPEDRFERFDGVWHTHDRAVFAGDGSFRLTGRADHIVKRAGRPVDLEALADLLVAQPGVGHARVRARASALDVDLVAEIVPAGPAPEPVALARHLAALLPSWQRPTHIEIVAPPADLTKWRSRA